MIFSGIFFRPEDWLTATEISLCSYFFLDYLHFFLTSNVFIISELQNAMTSCERRWHYDVTENTLLLKKVTSTVNGRSDKSKVKFDLVFLAVLSDTVLFDCCCEQ